MSVSTRDQATGAGSSHSAFPSPAPCVPHSRDTRLDRVFEIMHGVLMRLEAKEPGTIARLAARQRAQEKVDDVSDPSAKRAAASGLARQEREEAA